MKKQFITVTLFALVIFSCGPRSGVSNDNENQSPGCGVTEEDYKPDSPTTTSQIDGQKLFSKFCIECHRLDKDLNGGNELKGVCDRIPKGDWFKRFVLNSDSLKMTGDAYTLKIDNENNSEYEHNFKTLSDQDLANIYNYLKLW